MFGPLASQPWGGFWAWTQGATNTLEQIAAGGIVDAVYLVEIEAYVGGLPATIAAPIWGGQAWAAPGFGGLPSGEVATLRYADKRWTGAPDDPYAANVNYPARVSQPLRFERQAPLLPDQERRVQIGYGEIELVNADGALDDVIATRAVAGRPVTVRVGSPMPSAYLDFSVVGAAVATGWQQDDTSARLSIRDTSYRYDVPLQVETYDGSGGLDGSAEVAGLTRPLTFGLVRNLSPALIDPANLIYQVHDGAVEAVDAVYERGDSIAPAGADYADYAALTGATIPTGSYATCHALGLFRLGSSPAGQITADVRGDASGGYVDTVDALMIRLIDYVGIDSTQAEFSALARGPGGAGVMGWHSPAGEQARLPEALSALAGSVAGWWGARRDGLLTGARLRDPAGRATQTLSATEVLSLQRMPLPAEPRWRQRVAYRRNWTVQEDVVAGVADERRAELAQQHRVTAASDTDVRNRNLMALDPPVLLSLLDDEADALAVAQDIMALHGTERGLFSANLARQGLPLQIGDAIRLVYPRYGLDNGRDMAVVGIGIDARVGETALILWG